MNTGSANNMQLRILNVPCSIILGGKNIVVKSKNKNPQTNKNGMSGKVLGFFFRVLRHR